VTVRPIRIEGDVAYVPLTKGYEAVIDAADVHLVGVWNWSVRVTPRTIYASRTSGHGPNQKTVRMHRFILDASGDLEVDHIDSDGLNNRRSNLRLVTKAQNQHNSRPKVSNTSGIKGVRRSKGKWAAEITFKRTKTHLGYFADKEAAAAAYAKASAEFHGQYGRTA
jgi:HNH endonuclease/AP2 domain